MSILDFRVCALLPLVACVDADIADKVANTPADSIDVKPEATLSATTIDDPNTNTDAAIRRRGEIVFLRCRSCHSVVKNGPHLTGPNLHALFGASAGTKDGFVFSDALASSDIVWDADTLNEWLKQPAAVIPGNVMVFAGLPEAGDRAALIAYLAEKTQ